MFMELLGKIKLKDNDTLYILCDIHDRGPHPIIKEFLIYEKVFVNGKNYLLVHAGLGNYSQEKDIVDYSLHELIWVRADYDVRYFEDTYVIMGHTSTQTIEDNPHPGYIYRRNNHIVIDYGSHYPGERLAALCLDTGEEYYSTPNEMEEIDI